MSVVLDKNQIRAIERLRTGSILMGGTGSGKSRTALVYFYIRVAKGQLSINNKGEYGVMKKPKNLYIITTARKRDTLEWEEELADVGLSTRRDLNNAHIDIVIDSWNNIKKYTEVKDAFFIFDEQRVVGSGAWVKSFLKIVKKNEWILLSATPGDGWMDYVPVFIANGFYKNRTEFVREHVVYNPFVNFPKVDRYLNTGRLIKHRRQVLVELKYNKHTKRHYKNIQVKYDKEKYDTVLKKRWNVFKDKPVRNVSELCYTLRRVINEDASRIDAVKELSKKHDRLIIFYNFNYELEALRKAADDLKITKKEWNGFKHEPLPNTKKWLYLVQYNSNAEGWNCTETDAMIFYSQTYSYRTREQASGRIDRRTTLFENLYYYILISKAGMDQAIQKTLKQKKNFNEKNFIDF